MPLARTEQISVDELNERLKEDGAPQVLDVRRPGEWQAGHIQGARHIPLNRLMQSVEALDKEGAFAAICAGGYRSSIAAGILEQQGFKRITNVVGGMTAWVNAKLDVTV